MKMWVNWIKFKGKLSNKNIPIVRKFKPISIKETEQGLLGFLQVKGPEEKSIISMGKNLCRVSNFRIKGSSKIE